MAQEVGGGWLHLKEARGCVTREGEDGGELPASWFAPDLPLLEATTTNLGAQLGVRPGEIEAVGRVGVLRRHQQARCQ